MHPTPRPHQKEAREAVQQTLLNADRTKVVMACGTGKTLVALWCAEDLSKSVSAAQQPITGLVLVPSLALLQQTYQAWRSGSEWGARIDAMCVCSDPSVMRRGVVTDDADPNDASDLDNLQVQDLEFPVVTDPQVVRAFLDERPNAASKPARVIFCTYQSAAVVGQAMRMRPDTPPLDFLIADEAHKTVGDGNSLSYCLRDENLPARKRIFFTATPRHYTFRSRPGKADDGDYTIASMDDERLYGPQAYALNFAQAAQLGLIVPYRIIISVVDSTRLDAYRLKDARTAAGDQLLRAQDAAHQIALAQAIQEHSLRRVISFHSRIVQAQEFVGFDTGEEHAGRNDNLLAQLLPGCELMHVNGTMSSEERAQLMQSFAKADQAIISNAKCLTEGVDVPAVDLVAFIEPKKSKVDIAQAAGRAMRISPGKTAGYVLVPLLLSPRQGETLQEAARRAGFADAVATLRAMQEVDEQLGDALRQALHANGSPKDGMPDELADCLEILAPDGELISTQELRQVIKTELLRQTVPGWQQGIDEATAYKQAHGHLRAPYSFVTEAGFPLGMWISVRRVDLKTGRLSAERKAQLEELGMVWHVFDQKWQDALDEVTAYRQAHGHLRVPHRFVSASGFPLGTWVVSRRTKLKAGQLSQERKAQLDALGMLWDLPDQKWQEAIDAVTAYRQAHGHINVPASFVTESGFSLGTWISGRRTDLKAGRLSPERKAQLEELGMLWGVHDQKWHEGIEAATAYSKEHGHLRVPQGFITEAGLNLGSWISSRRANLKAGHLSQERKAQLDELGMVWHVLDQQWQEGIEAATAFRQAHGHLRVPRSFRSESEVPLGNWIKSRRVDLKAGHLSQERKAQLDALGMVWHAQDREQLWQDGIEAATAYRLAHGHLRVPKAFVTESGFPLGNWISQRRSDQKAGRLSQERKARLDELGMLWDQHPSNQPSSPGRLAEWFGEKRLKAPDLDQQRSGEGAMPKTSPFEALAKASALQEEAEARQMAQAAQAATASEIESSGATETEQADRFTLRHAA